LKRRKKQLINDIDCLERENKHVANVIAKMKAEYPEQIRRMAIRVREEEAGKYQAMLQALEHKLKGAEDEITRVTSKNQELIVELQGRDREYHEHQIRLENELSRARSEIAELRNQFGVAVSANEKMKIDLSNKESIITRLQVDVQNLQREQNRLRDIHQQEIDRVMNDYEVDLRKWEENDRIWTIKIDELERHLRAAENDANKYKTECERIREIVNVNVNRALVTSLNGTESRIFPF